MTLYFGYYFLRLATWPLTEPTPQPTEKGNA
jgi:hypothetical protein